MQDPLVGGQGTRAKALGCTGGGAGPWSTEGPGGDSVATTPGRSEQGGTGEGFAVAKAPEAMHTDVTQ